MAGKNIVIAGATFNGVPSIDIPTSGGGSASFVEVSDTTAVAADVAQGKYFYTADGNKTAGTASGAVVQPLSVTQNGTYNPPSGVDGYAPVTVYVSGGETYDLLEYIQSDGTQVIDTGLIIPASSQLQVEYSPLLSEDYRWAFGAEYAGNSSFAGVALIPSTNKLRIYSGNSQFREITNISYDGTGNYSPTITTVNTDSTANLFFFGLGRIQTADYRPSNIRFRKARLNNRFYLPFRRKSDGICGLWDNVANQFLTDSLNGNPFVAGPVLLSF